ncbi:MAG: glycosyltransferase family 4 protein [Bacteroidetes bacterium]|nr:glycosyltransferase family 4 protein [Bacteroidota bacterium]
MQRKTILFFYNHITTFVQKDIELLSDNFLVLPHDFYTDSKLATPFSFLKQKFFLLRHILGADVLLCQFAGYHSLLPALFARISGKKCFIVVGGTDAHNFPGIGYGNFQKRLLRLFTEWSYTLCTRILPKHKSLMLCDYEYDIVEPNKQGIYANIKNLKTPYTEVFNGYDAEQWKCNLPKRKRTFITVSGGWGFPFQYQLKGIDLVVNVAPHFPDCEFAILGVPNASLIQTKSDNVKILPPAKNSELSQIYSEFEFYLQLSMAEGFPNSLCEAMLCECVPVGSAVFSIPDIIGDSGFILRHRSEEELIDLIKTALATDTASLGKKARNRIAENYDVTTRKKKLLEILSH